MSLDYDVDFEIDMDKTKLTPWEYYYNYYIDKKVNDVCDPYKPI